MKTTQEAIAIAQAWEDEKTSGPGACVARALLAHINSLASPQVTDEQIEDIVADYLWTTGFGGPVIVERDALKFARAILALSAPPAAETPSNANVWRANADDTAHVFGLPAASQEAKPVAADWRPDWQHAANEWADVATSAAQWLRNIVDGISDAKEALANTQAGIAHCMQVVTEVRAAAPQEQAPADKDGEIARLNTIINQPMNDDFLRGVSIEAEHQRQKWGDPHDRSKSAENWFWLVGYLAGKCLRACITGDKDKAQHHTISSAAALFNWHKAISRDETGAGIGADVDTKPRSDGGHEGENVLQSQPQQVTK